MIGTDLNLDLPDLSDTYSVSHAKFTTALEAIEDSLAEKATPAALDITSNLSIGGNHLTNVGGLILADGNAPTAEGSVYYESGAFYLKDAAGVIQLTSNGGINLSSAGGIGGDYGLGPENVVFNNGSGEYRFFEDEGNTIYADLRADDVILMEDAPGTDSVRLRAPSAVTTSYSATFPAAPPAVKSVLQMDTDGTLVPSNALADLTSVTMEVDGNITVSGDGAYEHGMRMACLAPIPGFCPTGTYSYDHEAFGPGAGGWSLTASGVLHLYLNAIPPGARIHKIRVVGGSAGADWSFDLITQQGSSILYLDTSPSTGALYTSDLTIILDTPYIHDGANILRLNFSGGTAQPLELGQLIVFYDHVSYPVPLF